MKYEGLQFFINAAAVVMYIAAVACLALFTNDTKELSYLFYAVSCFVGGSVTLGFSIIVKAAIIYLNEHEPKTAEPENKEQQPKNN